MDFLPVGVQVSQAALSFKVNLLRTASRSCAGDTAEPADRCVIVMSAGVDDNVFVVVVRQVDILGVAGEGKLQDAHSRESAIVPQGLNIGRDHAQIFGDDWQLTQGCSNCGK